MIYGNSVGSTLTGLPTPKTVEVGQVITVSEVDDNGKVIATEATTIPIVEPTPAYTGEVEVV